MPDNCIFCSILAGKIPGRRVYEDERVVALEDVSPQAPHHYLIIPRRHIPTTLDLTPEDNDLIGHIHQVAGQLARDFGFAADGFRLVNNCNAGAGQSVWHLHFHLLGGRNFSWPPG